MPNYDDLPLELRERAAEAIALGETTPIRSYFINCCCQFVVEKRALSELEMVQGGSRCGAFNDPFPYACPKLKAFEHQDLGIEPDDVGQSLSFARWAVVQGKILIEDGAGFYDNQGEAALFWVSGPCLKRLKRAGQARNGYAHYGDEAGP